jgi:Putative lumazine-binding
MMPTMSLQHRDDVPRASAARQPLFVRLCLASAVLVSLVASAGRVAAQNARNAERDAVVAAVQEFFRSMEANDVAAAQRVMLPDGQLHATRRTGDSVMVRQGAFSAHFERLKAARDTVVERMWDPEVRVHGTVAMLWTPYDLYVNGKFSHCGVDAFSLVRQTDGWKISSVIYTIEPTGCAPSPLGPLQKR